MNNDMQKVFRAGLFLILILSFFVIVFSLKTLKEYRYVGADIPPVTTITFSGEGEVVAVPDTATFTLSVVEEAKLVKDAQSKATEKMNEVLAKLKELGIKDTDIKTVSYNISPKYEYDNPLCAPMMSYCPPAKSTLTGYEVSQSVEVKVKNIDDAGNILSEVGALEVSYLSGLQFTVSNEDELVREARQKAIAQAKAKASELSKDLGVRLVRIISFSESGNYPPIYSKFGMGMGGAEVALDSRVAVELPEGETKIMSNVSITYEIR